MGVPKRWGNSLVSLTGDQIRTARDSGERSFMYSLLDGVDMRGLHLRGCTFLGSSMRGVNLSGVDLTHVQLKGADLTGAVLDGSRLVATDLIRADFTRASLIGVDLTGASLMSTNFTDSNLEEANFNNSHLGDTIFCGANLFRVRLGSGDFTETDVRAFCDAKELRFTAGISIDAWTVLKSHKHPKFKQFMLSCGVPEIFAEFMIECARAIDEPLLRKMMQSTFISYGRPDERFARKLYEALRDRQVTTFFFPESATVGARVGEEIFSNLQAHDRVILVCSKDSLNRPGVLHEIQETFDREARDGGATYLLPIMVDDYVLTGWAASQPQMAERVLRRVVADFRKATRRKDEFDKALTRVVDALKVRRPSAG